MGYSSIMLNLVPDRLWTDFSPMNMVGIPAGRRLTVCKDGVGQITVFSPLPCSDENVAKLRRIGEPTAFVIPSRFHDNFYEDYMGRFPRSAFLADKAVLGDHPRWRLMNLSPSRPELAGFDMVAIDGMPNVQEHVFCHRATRTLIVADLFFNVSLPAGGLAWCLGKLAGIGGRPKPSRLWRAMIRDRSNFRRSLCQIMELDFERIIPGHGELIESNAKQVLGDAFSNWLV